MLKLRKEKYARSRKKKSRKGPKADSDFTKNPTFLGEMKKMQTPLEKKEKKKNGKGKKKKKKK